MGSVEQDDPSSIVRIGESSRQVQAWNINAPIVNERGEWSAEVSDPSHSLFAQPDARLPQSSPVLQAKFY